MNYDLKIHAHVSLGVELEFAYPGAIAELHYDISDEPGQDLHGKFDEIFEFLGKRNCTIVQTPMANEWLERKKIFFRPTVASATKVSGLGVSLGKLT